MEFLEALQKMEEKGTENILMPENTAHFIKSVTESDYSDEEKISLMANYIRMIRNLNDEHKRWKKEVEQNIKMADAVESEIKAVIKPMLVPGKTIDAKIGSVWLKTTTAVNVIDAKQLPEEYKKTKVTVTADKVQIKSVIESGVEVPGAEIEERHHVQVSL